MFRPVLQRTLTCGGACSPGFITSGGSHPSRHASARCAVPAFPRTLRHGSAARAARSTGVHGLSSLPQQCRAPGSGVLRHRAFATAAFTIRESGPSHPEQVVFVIGLNQNKFFGQDGSEEGLKLLERIVEQDSANYELLFGMSERELNELEEEFRVKDGRLTPSRDLHLVRNGEAVPMVQAGMVDKNPRRAVGRSVKTTQGHVAWRLWKNPREMMRLYWAFFKRKNYKDAARFKFWSQQMPDAAHVYFVETSELIAIRTAEHLLAQRQQGRGGSTVLTVKNEFFTPVTERLKYWLEEVGVEKLSNPEYAKTLRETAADLSGDVPDMVPLLAAFYGGAPLLLVLQVYLVAEWFYTESGIKQQDSGSEFDLVTGSRD